MIHTAIQKWGNSIAVRLPKSVAYGFAAGTRVQITRVGDDVLIAPQRKEAPSLRDLLRASPIKKVQRTIDWGEDIGKERVWGA